MAPLERRSTYLGRSAPQFGGSGLCIVKIGRAAVSFCISWQVDLLITKIFLLIMRRRGGGGNYCGCLHFFTSEENWHTHMGEKCVDRGTWSKSSRPNRSPKCPKWNSI
jgi:hypothetical protein